MKWLAAFLIFAAVAAAQEDWRKQVLPPSVDSDGRVTFRLMLPNAKKVETRFIVGPIFPLTKGSGDVWTGTSPPLQPGQYLYTFLVDGIMIADPSNGQTADHEIAPINRILVKGKTAMPWDPVDVPRGTLHRHLFRSPIAGDERDYWVYTPPGYDKSKKYPAIVLLHGFSDTAEAWVKFGRANYIMDSLIASGEIRPAILVIPYGYGIPFAEVLAIKDDAAGHAAEQKNYSRFEKSLIEEVLPRVEKEYGVDRDPRRRAVAGFSMGGYQALRLGLNHLDLFSAIGAFAGTVPEPEKELARLREEDNRRVRLLWIGFGKEDALAEGRTMTEWFTKRGIRVAWRDYDGGHSWHVVQRQFVDFLKAMKD